MRRLTLSTHDASLPSPTGGSPLATSMRSPSVGAPRLASLLRLTSDAPHDTSLRSPSVGAPRNASLPSTTYDAPLVASLLGPPVDAPRITCMRRPPLVALRRASLRSASLVAPLDASLWSASIAPLCVSLRSATLVTALGSPPGSPSRRRMVAPTRAASLRGLHVRSLATLHRLVAAPGNRPGVPRLVVPGSRPSGLPRDNASESARGGPAPLAAPLRFSVRCVGAAERKRTITRSASSAVTVPLITLVCSAVTGLCPSGTLFGLTLVLVSPPLWEALFTVALRALPSPPAD